MTDDRDRLEATREIAVRAELKADTVFEAHRRIEQKIDKVGVETTTLHVEARALIGDGVSKINSRITAMILGGAIFLVSLVGYLATQGAPWVAKEQYARDMSAVLVELRAIREQGK